MAQPIDLPSRLDLITSTANPYPWGIWIHGSHVISHLLNVECMDYFLDENAFYKRLVLNSKKTVDIESNFLKYLKEIAWLTGLSYVLIGQFL